MTYSPHQQVQELAQSVPEGQNKRFDCPKCGGVNTLSITKTLGNARYKCWRASCTFWGGKQGSINAEDLVKRFTDSNNCSNPVVEFKQPTHFTRIHDESVYSNFLSWYPTFGMAVKKGLVELRYDPKEHRLVFLYGNPRTGYGAVGRSIGNILPKWKRYEGSGSLFTCGPCNGVGVLVEDVISAASVGTTGQYTGIAILGTNLKDGLLKYLKQFDKLIIALDKDATIKSFGLTQRLSWSIVCQTVMLERDLKWYDVDGVEEILSNGV